MTIERFSLKFFARSHHNFDETTLIEIFREWIHLQKLGGGLLDIVDYRYSHKNPGIMLITPDISFAFDYSEGRFGLLAQHKSGGDKSHQERLLEVIRMTLTVGSLLEANPGIAGKLQFEAGNFQYIAHDRLLGPSKDETFGTIQPDLQTAAAIFYPGHKTSITKNINDPYHRLLLSVNTDISLAMSLLLQALQIPA